MNAFIKAKDVRVSLLGFGQMISEEAILSK